MLYILKQFNCHSVAMTISPSAVTICHCMSITMYVCRAICMVSQMTMHEMHVSLPHFVICYQGGPIDHTSHLSQRFYLLAIQLATVIQSVRIVNAIHKLYRRTCVRQSWTSNKRGESLKSMSWNFVCVHWLHVACLVQLFVLNMKQWLLSKSPENLKGKCQISPNLLKGHVLRRM